MAQQTEEMLVIAWILVLFVAVIGGMLLWQRGRRGAVARAEVIELSIVSSARLAVLLLVGIVVGAVGAMVPATSLPEDQRTVWVFLGALTLALATPIAAIALLGRLLRVGSLRLSPDEVVLRRGKDVQRIDRSRPFALEERRTQAGQVVVRVVILRQDDAEVRFSYPVPTLGTPVFPMKHGALPWAEDDGVRFGAEASEIHRRLRER